MAITTLDGYIAAAQQRVTIIKTASLTTTGTVQTQLLHVAGSPGAGVLAGTSTAAGVVPVGGTTPTAGFPVINNLGAGSYYLGGVEFGNTVAGRLRLSDCLFKAGAYAFNAAVTLAAQPSYAARVPGGTDFLGTELWIEAVTAFTGIQSIAVTYTNQAGVTGRTTGVIAMGSAHGVARMTQLPLAAGDTGLQKIESVTSTVATAGTFNVLVLRRLWEGRVAINNGGDAHDFLKTQLPEIFQTSAVMLTSQPDSGAAGLCEVQFEVLSG